MKLGLPSISKKVTEVGKLGKIKVKTKDSFALWESKGKSDLGFATVPQIKKQAGEKVIDHPDKNFTLYRDIYERVPVAKTAVDHTANFAIQSGFELEGDDAAKKKVQEWMDAVNFTSLAVKVMKQMQIWGNSYMEISEDKALKPKLLPPHTMFVAVNEEDDSEIVGYKQVIAVQEQTDFEPDEIVHFRWNDAINLFYGMSDYKAATATIRRLIQFQDDVGEIIHRYGHPILQHKLGTEDSPATPAQIADYISLQAQRSVGEDLVTSSTVEVKPITADLRMIQVDGLIKQLEHQIIAGLQIPGLFVKGGETTNKATADVELQAFDRRVKAVRDVFSRFLEEKVFVGKLGADVKISWHELSVESEVQKSEMLSNLTQSGVPLKTAVRMAGWGSWVDDIEKELKEMPAPPPMRPPGDPDEPKEDDFDNQTEWFVAHEKWKHKSK